MVVQQATDMVVVDLEKGTEETMGALDAQLPVPAMPGGGEKELRSGDLLRRLLLLVEGVAVLAGKTNPTGNKKWLPYYWLLVTAASVIVLSNHDIHAAPKDQQLFPPELAMFTVLLCAIFLILLSMKQMM